MSLTNSLAAAMSGLSAASKAAELVATNLANQQTPGFGQRDLVLAAQRSGGVRMVSVHRHADPVLVGDRRTAHAATSAAESRKAFLDQLEGWLGLPGDPGALSSRLARFETALLAAAGTPDSTARLAETLDAAEFLATGLRDLSGKVQGARGSADRVITENVATLNRTLGQIDGLNDSIHRMTVLGQDFSALADQRQALIDTLAPIVPLREIPRAGNRVALYTAGGLALVEDRATVFGFQPSSVVSTEGPQLAGLTANGRPVPVPGPVDGGGLAQALTVRDRLAPAAQRQLDSLAASLIERLEAADTSRATGTPGLFTDGEGRADPATLTGLAARIAVNERVDPARGGALWRLRDGLGTVAPGDPQESALLGALAASLRRVDPAPDTPERLVADLLSTTSTARLAADAELAFTSARMTALTQAEADAGVDTDAQMSRLLLIERAYGANARVIQTVDRMLATLMEI